ncbi:hypothetical protein FRX31_031173, partial [Thalictrum thalictroides]
DVLPVVIKPRFEGEEYVVHIDYPWKPQSCTDCNSFGNTTGKCVVEKQWKPVTRKYVAERNFTQPLTQEKDCDEGENNNIEEPTQKEDGEINGEAATQEMFSNEDQSAKNKDKGKISDSATPKSPVATRAMKSKKSVEADGKKISLLVLVETKVRQCNAARIMKNCSANWSSMDNYDQDPSGRIWVMWDNNAYQPDFFPLVESVWKTRIFNNPMYVLMEKLKILKYSLKKWSRTKNTELKANAENSRERLDIIQCKLHADPNNITLQLEERVALDTHTESVSKELAEPGSIISVMSVMEILAQETDLNLNPNKTTLLTSGVTDMEAQSLATLCGIQLVKSPVGLPLIYGRLIVKDYQPIVERATRRITTWKARSLSYAVAKQMSQLCDKFFWSRLGLKNKMHHASITKLGLRKECGGLGLRNFMVWNEAAYHGLVFNIALRKRTLWVKWIWAYKIKNNGFWTMVIPSDVS